MVHGQPLSPSGVLHQVSLSPTRVAASGSKFESPHVSIDISGNSASRSNWRTVLAIGCLVFATAIAQVVLASGTTQKGIHVPIMFVGEGYNVAAGSPAIGLLALGVAVCFIALSVLHKKNTHGGDWVKCVKRMTTIYSSIAVVGITVWSFVERAVYLELSGYNQCVVDSGTDNVEGAESECICLTHKSDAAKVDIAPGADMSCGKILDYTDDVFASYVLTLIILVLTVAGMWCKRYISKPKITAIVLEANPTPYVVTHTSPARQWGGR